MRNLQKINIFALENSILIYNYIIREQKSPEVLPRSFEPVLFPAERTGFEPANRFCRLHAFQACLFNHSSTSPFLCGCKGTN